MHPSATRRAWSTISRIVMSPASGNPHTYELVCEPAMKKVSNPISSTIFAIMGLNPPGSTSSSGALSSSRNRSPFPFPIGCSTR